MKQVKKCAFNFYLGLCLFIPFQFALNPGADMDLAILRIIMPLYFVVLVFIFFEDISFQQLFLGTRTARSIAGILILSLISILFSLNIFWSVRKILFLFSLFPIFWATLLIIKNNHKRQRQALFFLVIGATLVASVGLIQFFSQYFFGIETTASFMSKKISPFFLGNTFSSTVSSYPSWLVNSGGVTHMRLFSIFPDPHMLAFYLEMIFPMTFLFWKDAAPFKRRFAFFSSAIIAISILFTFTRGSYVAIMATGIMLLFLLPRKIAIRIALGICVLIVFFVIAPKNPVALRASSTVNIHEGSNNQRMHIWKDALPIIAHNPLGVGIGSYPLAIKNTASYREPIYAHNLYLDIAAELGILASLIFIFLIYRLEIELAKKFKIDEIAIVLFASILTYSIHSLVESGFYSVHALTLFLIIISLSSQTIHEKNNR